MIGVTALLGLLGGLAGAFAGSVVIAIVNVVADVSPDAPPFWRIFALVSGLGFLIGAFLAPGLTWLYLRRVPIWRAAIETSLAGSLAFSVALVLGNALLPAAGIAVGTALLAAARLRFAFRARPQRETIGSPES